MHGSEPLQFTGERFLPECSGAIALEHWHRYAAARQLAAGRRVLDAASGEGYGTAYLAEAATTATGVDIDPSAVASARQRYGSRGARYCVGSVTALPFPPASFDLVVSFETIEHIDAPAQVAMLAEIARVLAPDGCLLISSPNRSVYSDRTGYRNEFHVHELYRDQLDALLAAHFPHRRWLAQSIAVTSLLTPERPDDGGTARLAALRGGQPGNAANDEPVYFVVLASRQPLDAAAIAGTGASVLVDADEVVLAQNLRNEGEALRLDRLLLERETALRQRDALLAEREAVIRQRDAALARLERAVDAQRSEIEALVAEGDALRADAARTEKLFEQRAASDQRRYEDLVTHLQDRDRVVFYRQSWRWWLKLPLIRLKWYLDAVTRSRSDGGRA